jgi:hypothetical protein
MIGAEIRAGTFDYLLWFPNVSIKTVRNVIDGSLRAMMRNASKSGLEVAFPFADLEWPRHVVPGPDPFTEG